jgi:hypothetical protein
VADLEDQDEPAKDINSLWTEVTKASFWAGVAAGQNGLAE